MERAAAWLRDAFQNNRVPFLSALITGFLAHGFAFANKLVGYDEVGSLFNKGTTASSGRWGLDLLSAVFPDVSMPWIYGILSVVLLSIAACVIVRTFRIRSKVLQALVAGSILAFPSLTATVIYLYTLSSYAVSFLLAVLAFWLLQRESWKAWLTALVLMVCSLGIYQAYIAIPASLLVLVLIQDLLQGASFWPVVKKGLRFLAFLVLSLAGYWVVTQIFHRFSGVELNSYANARITFRLSYLPTGIYEAYVSFYRFFSVGKWGLMVNPWSQILHVVCVAAVVLLLLLWLLQKKRPGLELALLGILLALLPLAINCMYLFVSADPSLCAIHTLVLYGFIAVYVFAAVVAEACDLPELFADGKGVFNALAQNMLLTGMLLSLVINIYAANSVYLGLHLRYENAYAFYTSLLSDMRQQPGYDSDTRLALIGDYEGASFYDDEFGHLYRIMGADGFQPDSHSNWFFLFYYLGLRVTFAEEAERAKIASSEAFAQMPVYPYHGSIQMFDDVLVVKFSDP